MRDISESSWGVGKGGAKETNENLSVVTWCPSRDPNQTHPDYKSESLSPKPGVHKFSKYPAATSKF